MINKFLVRFKIRVFQTYFHKRFNKPEYKGMRREVRNIAILYSIPLDSPRNETWNDGFVDAVRLLRDNYKITWVNIEAETLSKEFLEEFDFLLIKSNWNWGPDKLLRNKFKDLKVKKGLAIAGVSIPPNNNEISFYDVLWYETEWYKKIISNHPNVYHGFGINKRNLVPIKNKKEYDYICIGAFLPHKRMELIKNIEGKIMVIGEGYNNAYSQEIIELLNSLSNVTLLPFVKYSELPEYFSRAKIMYIPASVNGGGERAILEARHCGLDVKIEKDNMKLKELLTSPIWDSLYYKNQLEKGIKSLSV